MVQVEEGRDLGGGLRIRRKAGTAALGDLPDWVGWDDDHQCVVVAEAKGSYGISGWIKGTPQPVTTALEQLDRVEIRDAVGLVSFKTWVVASRWATSKNNLKPVLMEVDPISEGRSLRPDEKAKLKANLRAIWLSKILQGLNRHDLATFMKDPIPTFPESFARDIISLGDSRGYGALVIQGGAVVPLIGDDRIPNMSAAVDLAERLQLQVSMILIDADEVERGYRRSTDGDLSLLLQEPTMTATSIKIDGLSLFIGSETIKQATLC
jgi:hypothetical protein